MDLTQTTNSQLFLLRVWVEELGDGRTEIRGTLKHVLSGETLCFREWQTLTNQIESVFDVAEKREPSI